MREPRTTDFSVLAEAECGKGAARARFLGAIVSAASVLPSGEFQPTPLRCRRRPSRCRCRGQLEIGREGSADVIRWRCPLCGDHGAIKNWRHTRWDLSAELLSGRVVPLSWARARKAQHGRTYELIAELIDGPVPFDDAVLRRVRIGGCRTLCDLHALLAGAFDGDPRASHEFLFGAMYEHDAQRYLSAAGNRATYPTECSTVACRIDSLDLLPGQIFGYVRDLELPWTYRLTVISTFHGRPDAQVLERIGQPPRLDDAALLEELSLLPLDDELVGPFDDGRDADPPLGLHGDAARDRDCPCAAFGGEGRLEPQLWSAMEEVERLLLILEKHARSAPREHAPVGSALLHALIHDLAEQALVSDPATRRDLRALMRGGTSRHGAIHILGQRLIAAQLGE